MSLIKDQSIIISSLQKTIISLQSTIDGLNVRLEGFENCSRGVGGDVLGNVDKEVDKEVSNNDVKKVANENFDINVTTSSIHTHRKPIHENVDKISINVTTSSKNAHLKPIHENFQDQIQAQMQSESENEHKNLSNLTCFALSFFMSSYSLCFQSCIITYSKCQSHFSIVSLFLKKKNKTSFGTE